jgi:Beta-1,3-glucanase
MAAIKTFTSQESARRMLASPAFVTVVLEKDIAVDSNRRLFLASLASSAALAACSGGALLPRGGTPSSEEAARRLGESPFAATTTPLTFVNNSKTPTNKIWFAYYGLDPATGKRMHMAANGKLVPNVTTSKPTAALAINAAASATFAFPQLDAGRMYVSIGKPLLFAVNELGYPTPPQSANPKDPNYNTPWDFFETTFVPQAGTTGGLFNFNLSCVQSANVPLQFSVSGTEPSTKKPVSYLRGWMPGGYTKFLANLAANATFKKLYLPGPKRVIAAGTAIKAFKQNVIPTALFPATYLDAYIKQVWTKFTTTKMTFIGDPPPKSNTFVTWIGQVKNDQMTFTSTNTTLGLTPIVLNMPKTGDIFENDFLFCASGCTTGLNQNYANQIFGTWCAAFLRSMMLTTNTFANSDDSAWCKNHAQFYKLATTDYYSKFLHANSLQGLGYSFQSDDHCGQSSFVSVINPTGLKLTFLAS